MIVTFEQTYLQELYTEGKVSDKKHRFQPQIVSKYVKVVNLMKQQENVLGLTKYGSLHYEKLHGDKKGISSVRVNDQYRIEFTAYSGDTRSPIPMISVHSVGDFLYRRQS